MYSSKKEYREEIRESIDDGFLQIAMSKFSANYPKSRAKAFSGQNVKKLVKDIVKIKSKSIEQLDDLFNKFKINAEKAGAKIYIAKDALEANILISKIAKEKEAKRIIKSKSMTSEEIHLNPHLEENGFEVTETDLGEWIIQLRGEGPSHMVMPAIHLSKEQVADLFSDFTGLKIPNNVEELVKVARKELRQKYLDADLGITGANFAIADTGTIGLVTNEGNARLTSTLPKTHIALVGLEKLIESVEDALKIINILPKNATGQNITSYITWITGCSENTLNEDEKADLHIIFLDNGRKELAQNQVFSEVLNCVRCGACANVCPVYGTIGGHKMGHTYIGPVGLILTYFYHGKENASHLVDNCINCYACKEVCASGIDLPELINETQMLVKEEEGVPFSSKMIGKVMKNRKLFHSLLKMGKVGQIPFKGKGSYLRHLPDILFLKDQKFKSLPTLAPKALRDIWQDLYKKPDKPKLKIAFFSGCLHDFVYPEQVTSILDLFYKHKIHIEFPLEQTCCGLPLMMNNDKTNTKEIAKQNIAAFDNEFDYIMTMCASCASFLKNSYKGLVGENSELTDSVKEFSEKIIDFSSLVNDVLKIEKQSNTNKKIAYHAPCHLCRGLDVQEAPKALIDKAGFQYIETEMEEKCCGFGGTYSVKFPEISANIMNKKLDDVKQNNVDYLVTDCPGCILQLKGGAEKRKESFEVKHISELFSKGAECGQAGQIDHPIPD